MSLTAPATDRDALRAHLVTVGLAGAVQTSPANTWEKIHRMVDGDPEATFGLPIWRDATVGEVAEAVRSVCGADPRGADAAGQPIEDHSGDEAASEEDGPAAGWIDPEATIAALERHAERLAEAAARRAPVLLATGHPTGLLAHYMAVARELQAAGCVLLAPADGRSFDSEEAGGRFREIRYLDGVACVSDGASLRHTHRDEAMRAMLDALGPGGQQPELVVADHGFAGAAITAQRPTLPIGDVNDVALPLAQLRGLTDAVLPIDDNLPPRTLVPVTGWVLDRLAGG
jgi:hypothetical protein